MIFTRRWSDYAPGVGQFRGYRLGWLRGDVAAGLTVAAYLVPQVMAYSTLARLPPITGLWAAIVCTGRLSDIRLVPAPIGRAGIDYRID
jgi:SulP family sulfate permease